ncbi:MAG: hypothetical protein ACOVQT_10060 [Rubrivivax sp.]|jgi:hypothetical protein
MGIIYRKTAKGIEEIQTRQWRLSPRARSALIMVDGQRQDEDLAKMLPGQALDTLQELLAGGFIEVAMRTAASAAPAAKAASAASAVPPAPVSPAPVASAPAAPRAAPGEATFEQIRAEAVRRLLASVGPVAEDLAIRMERARDFDALKPMVLQARDTIAAVRGQQAASDYITALTSM